MAAGVWRKNASFCPDRGGAQGKPAPQGHICPSCGRLRAASPNSVRNYYYARVKEQDLQTQALHVGAFVPFGQDEIRQLLRRVLSAQANGISVRACTLEMGDGDNKAMLRYQNKYRSLLKTRPDLVRQVAAELAAEGVHFDPYAASRQSRVGRPRKESRVEAGELGRLLKQVEGVDGGALLEELHALALRAREQKHASQETSALKAITPPCGSGWSGRMQSWRPSGSGFTPYWACTGSCWGQTGSFCPPAALRGWGPFPAMCGIFPAPWPPGEAALGDVSS